MAIIGAIAVPHPPLIVPAVGRGEQLRIQDTVDAYGQAALRLLALGPDCIVITSPHAPLFRDAFHVTTDEALSGSMSAFGAPRERIHARCDVPLAREIIRRSNEAGILAIDSDHYRDDMDHATYVPLHFIRAAFRSAQPDADADLPCPIVRIGLSGFPPGTHRAFGRIIAQAAEALGRRVAFVASGDLSHKLSEESPYGFAPEGPLFDREVGRLFAAGNLEGLFAFDQSFVEAAAECGLRSFQIMAGAIGDCAFEPAMLSNEGPFGVGYCVATFLPAAAEGAESDAAEAGAASPLSPAAAHEVDPYVALARLSVETYVRTGSHAAVPADVPPELREEQAGVFVSLHERGTLRGCIGTIVATCGSIAQEILQNGVSACSRDPRFSPVRPEELDYLEYSVDVLGKAQRISSPAELDPQRYGVIVTKGRKRGLLLPNLEGVDTAATQLAIAKQKAGIAPSDEDVTLERFEVVRHTAGGEPRKR